jgi:hypothetical protein
LDKLAEAYINQTYIKKPSAFEVTEESIRILDAFLDNEAVSEVLLHPYLRLNLLAVHCRGPAASDFMPILGPSVAAAALLNVMDRRFLKLFFRRALFYNPVNPPPFMEMNQFQTLRVPLNEKNLRGALLASGSIPIVMSGIKNIPEAPRGMYRDGGVIDYHLDIDFRVGSDRIVLYPHYKNRIIPGWFDKKLTRRKPDSDRMSSVLMICPSEFFVSKLPHGKIPDRKDFQFFKGKDKERIEYWKTVLEMGRMLSEEFADAVESGKIRERVRPLACC